MKVDLLEENYFDINVIVGILKDYFWEFFELFIIEFLFKMLIKVVKEYV